ncbi:MAG: NAD(P)H-dependent oxidoreductase [Burkholderiaceae bacterium]|jgi:FMN reductase|nr:NAD(P)H-dependent oxidoreductase [Burkholderiaceae bacterium]
MVRKPFIVGLGGTTRPASTSERALQVAMARARALGCETQVFASVQLPQEPYDPAQVERSANALALVEAMRRCDGVVIATPAYHGGISGLLKNAIDFTEDLRGDVRVYLDGRAVGCIVCAEGPQAMGSTLASLRAIVHALRGWPTPYGATINSTARPFGGAGGEGADVLAVQACERVADEVVAFARMSIAAAVAA